MCLSENGEVYSFGYNGNGQLGLGNNQYFCSPQLIESLKDVEFIACGGFHTFCKTINNDIYSWGFNNYGQLGLVCTENKNTPILCSSLSNEDVIDIKCGDEHTLVLTSNGDVLSCGSNTDGQSGRETDLTSFQIIEDLSDIIKIECGDIHSICIDINNDLYFFGYNYFGQLGLGDTDNRNKPIKHPPFKALGKMLSFIFKHNVNCSIIRIVPNSKLCNKRSPCNIVFIKPCVYKPSCFIV